MATDQLTDSDKAPLLPTSRNKGGCMKARHSLALLAFFGFFNLYCMRVNLHVALVAMVNYTSSDNTTEVEVECLDHNNGTGDEVNHGEFHWGPNTQSLVLGAFFYGCIVTQIPGGWLAERVGGKRLFGYGCLVTSLLTLLTPVAAKAGVPYLVTVRVLEGMGEGVTMPAMLAMWAVWAPVYERSALASFAYSGSQLGTVFAMPISGILCTQHDFAGGWPSVFYVFGTMGCLWFALWMFLVSDTPAQHPTISDSERRYIEASVGKRPRLPTPWGAMLRSPAVWGIMAAHFANHWGFYSMLTSLPTYMKTILHFPLAKNGILSGVPYIILWLTQMASGQIADYIRRRGYLSTATTRKVMNTVGLAWPACFLIATGYTGCNHDMAVVLLTLGVGVAGFTMAGFAVNHLDIAPCFAGTLMGITNAVATIPGFLGPQVVGLLTQHHQTVLEWRTFFFITGGIYLAGLVLFILLARGHEQPWAQPIGHLSFTETYNQERIIPPPSPPPSPSPSYSGKIAEEDYDYGGGGGDGDGDDAASAVDDYFHDDDADDSRTVSITMKKTSVQ